VGKGKNSRAANSQKIIEVDEDQVLEVIENKEFLAMRAATSSLPVPSTTKEQLKELVDERLI
jgi:ATP phosphoribosyltransferase regulatory subunit HisZ